MSLLERVKNFATSTPKRTLISSVVIALLIPLTLLAGTKRWELRAPALGPEQTPTATPTPTLPPRLNPLGEQKTLVIMFNFQDKPDDKPFTREEVASAVFTGPNSLNSYYKEFSFNQTGFTGEVVGWYTTTFNSGPGCVYNIKAVEDMARAEGVVDVDSYRRRIYLHPYVSACGTSGSTDGDPSETTLNGTIDLYPLIHEVGHNLSLGHAHGINCGGKTIDHYDHCQVIYYGDPYSPQGSGTFHHNVFHKASLGWISSPRIQEITTNGLYKIYPLERPETGTQVLKIKKHDTDEYYYLEYRRPIGFDANLPPKITSGVLLHIGYYIPYVIWPETYFSPETYLLDTTPGTPGDFGDAALTDNASFYDEINNITVTQIAHDENSAIVSVSLQPTGPTPTPTAPPGTPTPTPTTPPGGWLKLDLLKVWFWKQEKDLGRGHEGSIILALKQGSNVVLEKEVQLDENGEARNVELPGVETGTYNAFIYEPGYLTKKLGGMTINDSSTLDFTKGGTEYFLVGDFNGDQEVNILDFSIFVKTYGKQGEE